MAEELSLYAVFGHPIAHSLSPVLHNAAFQSSGLSAFYLPVDCPPAELMERLAAFRSLGGRGVNLTRPLKETVIPYLSAKSDWVDESGAANTLCWTDEGWAGDNTDCQALFRLIRPAATGEAALVLGSGGAARASAAVLKRHGYRVVVAARRPRNCVWADETIAWPERISAGETWAVVVNATPLGQIGEPEEGDWPLPSSNGVAVEWVYRPRATVFARQAQGAGRLVVDGLTLLIEQAALAWEVWFDQVGPRHVMWEAVRSWA
ncbi:MAG: shikimate dehydrogenase [Firmicutes bacterium]|nr:shikimate dehydrogenase [Bacillota bacterium]